MKMPLDAMKQAMKVSGDTITIKTQLFDLPGQIWRSGFDSFCMMKGSSEEEVISF